MRGWWGMCGSGSGTRVNIDGEDGIAWGCDTLVLRLFIDLSVYL